MKRRRRKTDKDMTEWDIDRKEGVREKQSKIRSPIQKRRERRRRSLNEDWKQRRIQKITKGT